MTKISPKISMEEATENLTGFDELAIEKHFGMEWTALAQAKPTMLARALWFVQLTRDRMPAVEAKDTVMSMRLADVEGMFADPEEDLDADDEDTESGKDD